MTGLTPRYSLLTVSGTDPVSATNDLTNNWTAIDLVLGSQTCTSGARPSAPGSGYTATETDTSTFIFYNGTTWDLPQGRARVCTSSTRPTGAELWQGQIIEETDTGRILYYNGSAWTQISYTGFVCTSSTHPSAPFTGLIIYETDTSRFLVYNGSAYVQITYNTFVCTSSTHPSSPFSGLLIYETDTTRLQVYNGSAYVQLAYGAYVCTSSTHPASPFTGLSLFETDTGNEQIYNGTTYQQTHLGPWIAYTPAWTAVTTNPGGTYNILGYYRKSGHECSLRVSIKFSGTTTFGTGAWQISLPFTPKFNSGGNDFYIGTCYGFDSGVDNYTGAAVIANGGSVVTMVSNSSATSWGASTPVAWGASTSNFIGFELVYETTT